MTRLRPMLVLGALTGLAVAATNRAAAARDGDAARVSRRCTMMAVHTGASEYSQDELVILGQATHDTARAPGTAATAPDVASPIWLRRNPPTAWRFRIAEVPAFVAARHADVLKRAHGAVWVVPWSRTASCELVGGSFAGAANKGLHAVLFLRPRAESLWVRGEPTFDAIGDWIFNGIVSERHERDEPPISVHDLRVFLAVYPRLAITAPWRDGSAYAWALRHTDSANTAILREKFQIEASERLSDRLVAVPSPLLGVWRGAGMLADGDSLHFWMRLIGERRQIAWGDGHWWYSGPARFEAIPPPSQYELLVSFSDQREGLSVDTAGLSTLTVPMENRRATATSEASWAWIAQSAPAARRPELSHNDSVVRGLAHPPRGMLAPSVSQVISLNSSHDELTSQIKLGDSLVGRWTARRVP